MVPRQVLDGFLSALHIQLNHPSAHQLKMVTRRFLFALNIDRAIERVSSSCHNCVSLRKSPHTIVEQTTTASPDAIGTSFAANVEFVSLFTTATLLDDKRHETLRDALVRLCIEFRPLDGPPVVFGTDPAPGFKALTNDELLQQHRLTVEIGRIKNTNKNPVAERAV